MTFRPFSNKLKANDNSRVLNIDTLADGKAIQVVNGAVTTALLGADQLDTAAVTADKLAADAVETAKIKDLAVTADKLAVGSVTAGKIADRSLPGDKLQLATITAAEIAGSTITEAKLAGSFSSSFLADNAIDSRVIADDAVLAEHLATDSVTSDAIAAAAVGEAELADGSVTQAKLNLAAPVADADAATKAYVDALVTGLHFLAPVSVKLNYALDGAPTGLADIDGQPIVADTRVFVLNNDFPIQSGIYLAKAGTWERAPDFAVGKHVHSSYFFVNGGNVYANTSWVCTNDDSNDTVGTAALAFSQMGGQGLYQAGSGLALDGNTFSIPTDGIALGMIPDALITGAKLANAAVDSDQIKNDAVTQDKIADLSVGTGEIIAKAVTTAKLADEAVDTLQIKLGAVDTDQLHANAVTAAKMADGAISDLQVSASAAIAQSKISGLVDDLAAKLALAGGTMTGNITMSNSAVVKGLPAAPSANDEAASKKYVDDKFDAVPSPDLTPYLKKDGSEAMTGALEITASTSGAMLTLTDLDPIASVPQWFVAEASAQGGEITVSDSTGGGGQIYLAGANGIVVKETELKLVLSSATPDTFRHILFTSDGELPVLKAQSTVDALNFTPDVLHISASEIDAGSVKITSLADPTAGSQDAATAKYVDDAVAAIDLTPYFKKDGSVAMTGDIDAGTHKVIHVVDPVDAQDAATKAYVDTKHSQQLSLTGGTMSGAIAMATSKITGLGDPTAAQDAATKAYVDLLGMGTKVFLCVQGGQYATLQAAVDAAAASMTANSGLGTVVLVGPKGSGDWGSVTFGASHIDRNIAIVGLGGSRSNKVIKVGAINFSPTGGLGNVNNNEVVLHGLFISGSFGAGSAGVTFGGTTPARLRLSNCYVYNTGGVGDGIVSNNSQANSSLYVEGCVVQCSDATTSTVLKHTAGYTIVKDRSEFAGGFRAMSCAAGVLEVYDSYIEMNAARETVLVSGGVMTLGYSTVRNSNTGASAIGVKVTGTDTVFGAGDATISVGSQLGAAGKAVDGVATAYFSYGNVTFGYSSTVSGVTAVAASRTGGKFTTALDMSSLKITSLANPTAAQDAATKAYADAQVALKLSLTGGSMTGAIAMGTNKITGLGDPTAAQDAATKNYVDVSVVQSLTASGNVSAASNVVLLKTNGGITATLPAASSMSGKRLVVKKTNALAADTIDVSGGGTIDGASSQSLFSYESITLLSDGSAWYII